jgi:flagellar M-ring protein FliF
MNAVLQSFKEMGQLRVAIIAGVALLLLGLFLFIALRSSSPVMAPLYANLSMEDSSQIVAELDKMGVPYDLQMNGTQILVPSEKVMRLRLALAQEGLPASGTLVGYEIFDKNDALGTSNFVHNVNMVRALEGELARTIGSLASVEKARVHLVLPKRELFEREKKEPTASVIVKLRGAAALEKSEVASIRHLVATAVPGLKPSSITIVDHRGKLLAKGTSDENNPEAIAETAEEFRVSYQARLESKIEELLERSVGTGKVKAQVTADIDFDRIVINTETYDPESQVARSIQNIEEVENEKERNVEQNVSVANNLPSNPASEAGTQSERNAQRTEETTNFEISKTVENHVKDIGTVNRLSVAVLVDGVYAADEQGAPSYQPRSQEELDKLATLVRSAIGFDRSRGDTVEVVNMQFSPDDTLAMEESPWDFLSGEGMQNIIQTLIIGIVAILAILLVIRPLVTRAIEASQAAEAQAEAERRALEAPGGMAQLTDQSGGMAMLEGDDDEGMIDIDRIQGRVKSSTYKKINDLIEKHPDETLTILRQWMFAND